MKILYCLLKEAAQFCGIFIIILSVFGTLLFVSLWLSKSIVQYITGSVDNTLAILWLGLPILLVLSSLSFATFHCYMAERDKKKKKDRASIEVGSGSKD